MKTSKVWFVTGASQGLGLFLVKKLLVNGYRVAATSRNIDGLKEAVGINDADIFLPLALDLSKSDAIDAAVQQTIKAFGRIDVLVNNAGYGLTGALEDIPDTDIEDIFDVNVLAVMKVTRSILPIMRAQRSGNIINLGSILGFAVAPGWSVYAATKAAIAVFSDVLALDVREFGIKVTAVEPSGFRTGFLAGGSLNYKESKTDGYQAVKDTQKRYLSTNGKQPGDPDRAADLLIDLAEQEKPPLKLFLGKDAYVRASAKIKFMTEELEALKEITISADYPE